MPRPTSPLTPEQRLRAQIAAHARWAHEDPTANAARGQAGLTTAKFEREVDYDRVLDPADGRAASNPPDARSLRPISTGLVESSIQAWLQHEGGCRADLQKVETAAPAQRRPLRNTPDRSASAA